MDILIDHGPRYQDWIDSSDQISMVGAIEIGEMREGLDVEEIANDGMA